VEGPSVRAETGRRARRQRLGTALDPLVVGPAAPASCSRETPVCRAPTWRAPATPPLRQVNRVLATLKREGLIDRHPHPRHGRILQLALTQEGKRGLDAGTPSVRALKEAIEMDLTPDQKAAIKNWLVTSAQRLKAVTTSRGA
jgi:hypothetical protein